MNMQEEYLKRHLIQTPVVKYVKEGYLFLKTRSNMPTYNKSPWVILSISEQPPGNHPSDITIAESVVDYNSCIVSRSNSHKNANNVSYDGYQSFLQSKIMNYIKDGYTPVFGNPNADIVATEIIMYIWCSHILDNYGESVVNLYYSILDQNSGPDVKTSSLAKIQGLL